MGLAEYIKSGVVLKRESIKLVTDVTGSGSVNLGSAYIVLSINTDKPCRLRLYDNSASCYNPLEKNRIFGDTNIPNNIALIGDLSMSSAGTHTIDPVIYGVVEDFGSKSTFYKIDDVASAPYPVITFNRYLLEDSNINTSARRTLPAISSILSENQSITGSINNLQIPKTYLLISASVSGSNTLTRLRLYHTPDALLDSSEISRPFASESSADSSLMVDAIMSSSQITHFVPKIIGANLRYIEPNLNIIKNDITKIMGNNELYYILQNVSSSGGPVSMSVSLHVFSLEE